MLVKVLILVVIAVEVKCQSLDNQKPRAKGFENRTAIVYANNIKGQDAKNRDYNLERQKGQANLHLGGGSKNYLTNAANGRASAQGAGGKTAIATKIGSGGTYETPRNKGDYRTSVQGNAKVVDLNSNAQQKLNVKDVGKEQDFVATGNKHTWEADPGDSDYKQGQLKNDGKPYDYTISKGADGKTQATLADQSQKSIFVGTKKYTCVGQKDGISNCQDQWGRKVGEVRGNKAGDVTVVNSLGIPIASAKAVKDTSGKPTVSVNNGIFNADSGQQVDKNCPGFNNDKVKPGKGITFKYANTRTVDGGQRWDWPACFDASIPVTLGAGILGKNLAFKFTPLVLPAGRLNCQDPATIACRAPAGQCYYCDMCDPVKRGNVQLLANAQSSICDAKGGDTVVVSATICPPPQASMANYCDHFSKGLGDPYWQKKGNLDVTFEVFNRKTDADYTAAKADRAKYSTLVSQFKKDNPKYLLSFSPPDSEVSTWYKYSQSDKVGCRQSLVNYNLGGSKANTGLLFEAATASGALSKNPCPAPTSSG